MYQFEVGKTYTVLGDKKCTMVKITGREDKTIKSYVTIVIANSPVKTEYTAEIEHGGFMWGYDQPQSETITFKDGFGVTHTFWAYDELKEDKTMNKYEDYSYENISVSLFPGFYDSILYDSDIEYYEAKMMEEEYGKKYQINDYRGFEKDVCKDIVNELWNIAPENICKDFKYEGMWSPKEYNFTTDKIQIKMKLNKEALHKYIVDNKDEFFYYIHEYWSTRDGFISSIPQTFEEWEDEFYNEKDGRKNLAICIALDWVFLTEITGEKHLDQNTMYEICDTPYYNKLQEIASNRMSEYLEEVA